MRRYFLYIFLLFAPLAMQAQYGLGNMVELSGVVMSSDSLRFLPYVSVSVMGEERGVMTNEKGVFSLIVAKGANIEFSYLGFKKKTFRVPDTLKNIRYSIIQLMVQDTFYLPVTIIRPAMTKSEFEHAFVNMHIPDDKIEIARKNTEYQTIRALALILPKDGNESGDYYVRQQINRTYWAGQQPPMSIFNPFAWQEFFKAWKRGDFRKK